MRSEALAAFLVGTLAVSGCAGGREDSEDDAAPAETPAVIPAPGSKTLRDPDLPFAFQYPPPFVEGRASRAQPSVLAAVLLDRRNAVLVSPFGVELPPDDFGQVLERKLREGGFEGQLSRQDREGVTTFSAVLEPASFSAPDVAGVDVGAKRYWFAAGGQSWEISCQFTAERREQVIAACDQIAGTLNPN